jgi:exopolysaccharide biosynthesis protein
MVFFEIMILNIFTSGVQAMGMASSLTSKSKEMLILLSSKTTHSISSSYCFSNESNNLLGIRAADGKLVWEKNFTEAIQYLNCSLIDVDNDGVDDCLLFPVVKSLSALNSLTGKAFLASTNYHSLLYG